MDEPKPNDLRDCVVHSWGLDIVYPYVMEVGGTQAKRREFRERLVACRPGSDPPGTSWRVEPPEELGRRNLGRWFFREVRSLFFDDASSDRHAVDEDTANAGEGRMIPKFRWFTFEGPLRAGEGVEPDLRQYRPAFLALAPKKGQAHGLTCLPQEVRPTFFALVSAFGVQLIAVRLRCRNRLSLPDAMLADYLAAHSEGGRTLLVLVPNRLHAELSRRRFEERQAREKEGQPPVHGDRVARAAEEPLRPTDDDLRRCLVLLRKDETCRVSLEGLGPSLPELLRASLSERMGHGAAYVASHGRVPVATHLLLSPESVDCVEPAALEGIEGLAARCHRHPSAAHIAALPLEKLQSEEFRTLHVTGSQRLHVSCEGFHAFGVARNEFEKSEWHDRLGKEYFLTWMLALHQSVVCQELSWCSYTKKDGRRDNEDLVSRFLEYNTEYDFSLVSPQRNIQSLYRLSRETLGVSAMVAELRSELSDWVEDESRREQMALNSVAVLAVLGTLATFLVGLNLEYFTNDSQVALWWGNGAEQIPGLIWFWLPLAAVAASVAASAKLRRHVKRVLRLLLKKE